MKLLSSREAKDKLGYLSDEERRSRYSPKEYLKYLKLAKSQGQFVDLSEVEWVYARHMGWRRIYVVTFPDGEKYLEAAHPVLDKGLDHFNSAQEYRAEILDRMPIL